MKNLLMHIPFKNDGNDKIVEFKNSQIRLRDDIPIIWDNKSAHHHWSKLEIDRYKCSISPIVNITNSISYNSYWGWMDYDLNGNLINYEGYDECYWIEGCRKSDIIQRRPIGSINIDWRFEGLYNVIINNLMPNIHFYKNKRINYPEGTVIDDFEVDNDIIKIITFDNKFENGKLTVHKNIKEFQLDKLI